MIEIFCSHRVFNSFPLHFVPCICIHFVVDFSYTIACVPHVQEKPDALVTLVQIDVASDESVLAAAQTVKASLGSEKLYALVNNAGTGALFLNPKPKNADTSPFCQHDSQCHAHRIDSG